MPKGFGLLTPERRREISSQGGKAAHRAGTAHRFTSEEAKAAGRVGGLVSRKRSMAVGALSASGAMGAPPEPEPKGLNGPAAPVAPTEPPPPAHPTEPAPPPVVEQTTLGQAHPDFTQSALDAAEIQRIHDEAMARS